MKVISTPWWTGAFDANKPKADLVKGYLGRVSKLIYQHVAEGEAFVLQIDKTRIQCTRKENTAVGEDLHMAVSAYGGELEYTFPIYSSWDNAQPTISSETSTGAWTSLKNSLSSQLEKISKGWEETKDQFNVNKKIDKAFEDLSR